MAVRPSKYMSIHKYISYLCGLKFMHTHAHTYIDTCQNKWIKQWDKRQFNISNIFTQISIVLRKASGGLCKSPNFEKPLKTLLVSLSRLSFGIDK